MSDQMFGFLSRLSPDVARAGSVSGERKGTVRKKAKQKCKKQVGPCQDVLIPICGDNAECVVEVQRCCSFLSTCDATSFLTCLTETEV